VTLKKPVRASVQVYSGRTIEPVWFLKLWLEHKVEEGNWNGRGLGLGRGIVGID
jgi:hypothetical protein